MLLLEHTQCSETYKNTEIITHFLEIVNSHIRVDILIELLNAFLKWFILYSFRNLYIFNNSICDIRTKISCVSDTETVPVNNLNFEDSRIYACQFWGLLICYHFVIEWLCLRNFCDLLFNGLHSLDLAEYHVVSVFVRMFDSIQKLDNTLFFGSNFLDKSFERLFSICVINSKIFTKIWEIVSRNPWSLRVNKFDILSPAFWWNRQRFFYR